jgi:hypothetical protein
MTPEQRTKALRDGEEAVDFYDAHPFETARQQIHTAWAKAQTLEKREELWFELHALDRVVGVLTGIAQVAKGAALEIKAEEAAAKGSDPYVNP